MSNTQQPFEWTERLVKEFLEWVPKQPTSFPVNYSRLIEPFKASRSSEGVGGRDWEVISVNYRGNITFWSSGRGYTMEELGKDGYTIHSVRRTSDNTIWAVGDVLKSFGTIVRFEIQSCKWMVAYTDLECGVFIENFEKAPIQEPKPVEKPPLGIIPEWLWKEQRIADLKAAIDRYMEHNDKLVPIAWFSELYALESWYKMWKDDINAQSKINNGGK